MGHSGWVSGVGFVCSNRLILQRAAAEKRTIKHFVHCVNTVYFLQIVDSQEYSSNLEAFFPQSILYLRKFKSVRYSGIKCLFNTYLIL